MVQIRAEVSSHALNPGMTSVASLSGQMTYQRWAETAKPPLPLERNGPLPPVVCAGNKATPSEHAHKAKAHDTTFDAVCCVSVRAFYVVYICVSLCLGCYGYAYRFSCMRCWLFMIGSCFTYFLYCCLLLDSGAPCTASPALNSAHSTASSLRAMHIWSLIWPKKYDLHYDAK